VGSTAWLTAALLATQAAPPLVERGTLPASWSTAATCPETPIFRVHEYNSSFLVLRQSGCTNFEKPFLYLIFGNERALLVDTGAPGAQVKDTIAGLLERWSAQHGRAPRLVVLHSHGHSDHVAGDAELRTVAGVQFADAPAVTTTIDLGNRTLDLIPIPGHEPASVAVYDRRTGILLTGDTLYPGRLYVRDAAAFRASIKRLVAFTDGKPIAHVLGAHIENTRAPFVDYPQGTRYQPDEHALELGHAHLLELDTALDRMTGGIERRVLRDFTVWPVER
jgi:hydroxyacylglutathione hydrolase